MVLPTFTLPAIFDHLPNDTEETLDGSHSLHQSAITALVTTLSLCGPRRGLPWFIGNQIKMIVPRRGRAPYMPSPDILIHPTLTNASRTSLVLTTDGPPTLVIEIASPSTALSNDLNLTTPQGKPGVYAALGIAEYLVFDPTAEFVADQVWARRLAPDGHEPWLPDDTGRWVSALGIAFAPQGPLLRVYDQDGRLVPIAEEMAEMLEQRDREMAALEAEVRRLRGE